MRCTCTPLTECATCMAGIASAERARDERTTADEDSRAADRYEHARGW